MYVCMHASIYLSMYVCMYLSVCLPSCFDSYRLTSVHSNNMIGLIPYCRLAASRPTLVGATTRVFDEVFGVWT